MRTLATVVHIVGRNRADPIAAQLLVATFRPARTAVVPVAEHVPAMVLAAAEQLGPIPCRHIWAYVFPGSVAMQPLPDLLLQEPASCSRIQARKVLGRDIAVVGLVCGAGGSNVGECNEEDQNG